MSLSVFRSWSRSRPNRSMEHCIFPIMFQRSGLQQKTHTPPPIPIPRHPSCLSTSGLGSFLICHCASCKVGHPAAIQFRSIDFPAELRADRPRGWGRIGYVLARVGIGTWSCRRHARSCRELVDLLFILSLTFPQVVRSSDAPNYALVRHLFLDFLKTLVIPSPFRWRAIRISPRNNPPGSRSRSRQRSSLGTSVGTQGLLTQLPGPASPSLGHQN